MVSKDHRLFIGIMLQYLRGFNFFFYYVGCNFLGWQIRQHSGMCRGLSSVHKNRQVFSTQVQLIIVRALCCKYPS